MWSSSREATLAVIIVFAVLTWLTVSLRVYVRVGMLHAFGRDDGFMLAAQIFFTSLLISASAGVHFGMGQHINELVPWHAERALLFFYLCEILYIFTTVFLKVSVGLFLLRVAFERLHILNIWFIMLSSAVLGVAAFFVGIFHCRPLTVGWSLEPHADSCVDISVVLAITYSVSALNVIADWTLGILPIFIVSGLQMSKRQKRIVVGILSFAALGSTATIVRLPYMVHLREAYDGRDGDFLYNTGNLVIWSIVELGVGITAGSLATLRPLLKLALARFGATDSSNDASGHKQHNVRKMNTWVPGEDFEVDHSRGRTTTTITAGTSRSHPGGKKGFGSELDKWTTSRASQITDNSVWKTERVRVRVDEIDRNDVEMGMGVRTFERRRSSWSAIEFDRSTADGSRTYSH